MGSGIIKNDKNEVINKRNDIIDRFEAFAVKQKPAHCPVKHRFTDGMYIREVFLPAGTLATSMIHLTNHPFVVLKGKLKIYDGGDNIKTIEAPYTGVTQANTRRLLYIEEDTIFITFHATDKTDIKEIENEILDKRQNPLVDDKEFNEFKEKIMFKNKEVESCHLLQRR